MTRGKAEDAGGLTPAKDDNAAPYHFDRRTLPIFKCVDYIKLNQEMVKFLELQIGMELLSIRSSNIAFTMGARGILLEKSYSYSGTIEKY
ncbi:MAG: hypothetical protein HFF66_09005 [Oscillospiraceae bacterium]|nr:hypothetical protein [Oscillospiraceae bacterium]